MDVAKDDPMTVGGTGESAIEEGSRLRLGERQESAERARSRAWNLGHERCLNAYGIVENLEYYVRTIS